MDDWAVAMGSGHRDSEGEVCLVGGPVGGSVGGLVGGLVGVRWEVRWEVRWFAVFNKYCWRALP